jgi:uncharacterized phiE125 gp8 family phage protein
VAPTFAAISNAACRLHCRVTTNDENALLDDYIESATDFAETYQNRCLRTSTWQAVYDYFPDELYLPNPPLQSATIAYLDSAGVSQALATTVYTVDAISQPGRIALKYTQSWPVTYGQIAAVTVTFVAGYTSAALIPARTKQAIRIIASHWYENREPIVVGMAVNTVPLSVIDLLDQDKFVSYR